MDNSFTTVQVSYRGVAAKSEAANILGAICGPDDKLEPPIQIDGGEVRLGAAEIIITLLLSSALKAIAIASLDRLENYLHSKIDKRETESRLQVVLKTEPGKTPKRFPINMRDLTNEAVTKFVDQIREAVNKL